MAARTITAEETALTQTLVRNARRAMDAIAAWDQAAADRMCRAVGWAAGNEETAGMLARMSVEESGMGSPEPGRRAKVLGILRDALRQKSMGVIEEIPDKGIVKYAKPAGVIASLIPVTSPYITPIGIAIYALKCKDAVIFSPHPSSRRTTNETVRLMRDALKATGAPEDLLQCVERPSIPLAQELMSSCDLTIATGGPPMVHAAYSSGKPAYGVGAGNATMVIDETADIAEAARNTRISKTNDHGSGCSADGNLIVEASIYDAMLAQLQAEGGYLLSSEEKDKLRAVYWDSEGRRTPDTIARAASVVAAVRASAFRPAKHSSSSKNSRSGRSTRSRRRSWGRYSPFSGTQAGSTPRSTWSAGSSIPAAEGTPAASTRSTMTISIALRWLRRSAASWCARCSRARTPAPSPTGCR